MLTNRAMLARAGGLGLALMLVALACGCGGGGGGGGAKAADTTAPTVTSPSLTVTSMQPTGGPVGISVTATDDVLVSTVVAKVTLPSGTTSNVTLTKGTGNTYSGTYTMPPLVSYTPQAGVTQLTYSIAITATDSSGNQKEIVGGTFTVPVPPAPSS